MIRKVLAVICGILAGCLLSMAIGAGLKFRFPDEFSSLDWGVLLWGEHWFLRAVVSLISATWAGFIAGVVGRDKGSILAAITVLPTWIIWVVAEYTALTGYFPFYDLGEIYVSLGSKISMGVIILAMFPLAWHSGSEGEIIGQENSDFFDSRRHTLLGIKWYHYIWLPIILHLIILQGSFAGFYFLTWMKALWKSGINLLASIIPTIFTFMLFGTLYLMGKGVERTYMILSGFEQVHSRGAVFVQVLKYIIGYQAIAVVLQFLIEYIHFTIGNWLS